MKRTRLLQIIKEEVANALNELKEPVNEMASIKQTLPVLDQIGDKESLGNLKQAVKQTLDLFKKDPKYTTDGRLYRTIPTEEGGDGTKTESYLTRLNKIYKEISGETIAGLFDRTEEEASEQGIKYNMGVSGNTINKNAAKMIKKMLSDPESTPLEPEPEPKSEPESELEPIPSLTDLASEEEPEAEEVGSKDEEWYGSEEEEAYDDMERLEKDEEASLKGLEGWEEDWDKFEDDEF